MYVVDCADERRLEESAQVLFELLQEEKLCNVPILIFANKKDLDFALPPGDVSSSINFIVAYYHISHLILFCCTVN